MSNFERWKPFLFFIAIIFLLNSCRKDELIDTNTDIDKYETRKRDGDVVGYNWTETEANFFSLYTPAILQSQQSRNGTNSSVIFHPKLIQAYNEIARQNEENNFIEGLSNQIGIPYWEKAYIYNDTETGQNVVLIPTIGSEVDKFAGGIIITEGERGNLIVNGISRKSLLQVEKGNPSQRAVLAQWLLNSEKIFLSNRGDEELTEAYCKYKELETEGNNGMLSPTSPPPTEPECEWKLVEMCSDDETQTTWIGGTTNMPPHIDHDRDGIHNSEDQDFQELLRRLGIDSQEFERRLRDWWRDRLERERGEYDEYWTQVEQYYQEGSGQDFSEFWDDLTFIWEEFDIFIGELWYELGNDLGNAWDSFVDWFRDLFYEIECYDWGRNGRDTRCQYVYIYTCEGAEGNWWESEDVIVCPGCSEQDIENQDQQLAAQISLFVLENNLQVFNNFIRSVIQEGDCPVSAGSSAAFSCFGEILADHLATELGIETTEEQNTWMANNPEAVLQLMDLSEGIDVNGIGQVSTSTIESVISLAAELNLTSEETVHLATHPNTVSELQRLKLELPQDRYEQIAPPLVNNTMNQHFSESNLNTITSLMIEIESGVGIDIEGGIGIDDIPRAEYIDKIDKIRHYLSFREGNYEEASDYLQRLLPYLIQQDEFTNEEVYAVYSLAYDMYAECVVHTWEATILTVAKTIKPFIEFALIEASFFIYEYAIVIPIRSLASYRISSNAPQVVINNSANVWNRINSTAPLRPNTTIPETFTLSTESGEGIYVQYSGTKRMEEMVTLQNNAINHGWFAGQRGLRSQLVLDDFAKSVDDIMTNNSNIIPGNIYNSGRWEIIFGTGSPAPSGGLRIFHASPIGY